MPLDARPRSPRQKRHIPEAEDRRELLLHDSAKWRDPHYHSSRGGVVVPEDSVKQQRIRENQQRIAQRRKSTKWVSNAQLAVSLFGKSSRVDIVSNRQEREHQRRLDEGTQVPMEASFSSAGATLPRGRPVTISTAARFDGEGGGCGEPVGPDPASYKPKPVRPHSASARLVGKATGPVVLHHGVALHTSQLSDKPATEKENPPSRIESSVGLESAVSFPKASRFDAAAEKLMSTQSPGPAAYSADACLGKSRQANVYKVSLGTSGRVKRTVVSNNSLFYATNSNSATPGVGEYTIPGGIDRSTAVSFSKAPREPPQPPQYGGDDSHRSLSVRPTSSSSRRRRGSQSAHHEGGDVDDNGEGNDARKKNQERTRDSSPSQGGLERHSIAAKLGSHSSQRFGKAESRRSFAIVKGQVVYNLTSSADGDGSPLTGGPGVGSYEVRDGLSVSERISPSRPLSARASNMASGRRFDYESPRAAAQAQLQPGPGSYEKSTRSQFDTFSFNKYIRQSQKSVLQRSLVPTPPSNKRRNSSSSTKE